jgi:hypothetical protein
MLTFEFSINILILLGVIAVSGFAGFSLRSRQLAKSRSKLVKVENEMISSHAEILELQKEYMTMELKLRGIKDPVIVMRSQSETETNEKLPNGGLRKKLLTKDLTPSRNEGYQMIYDNLLTKGARTNTGS